MLICLTGIDGCGKGTQLSLLTEYLEKQNFPVFVSKAYGDAEKECFSAFINTWSQTAILFLFQALHAEQSLKVRRALAQRRIVIADRWDEAYLAYHSRYGILSCDPKLRARLNEIAFEGISPDVTILLDVPVKVALKRLEARGKDFFDKLPQSYHQAMRDEYLRLAKEKNWHVVDGTRPAIDIHSRITGILEAKLR